MSLMNPWRYCPQGQIAFYGLSGKVGAGMAAATVFTTF
jgi:hypothetical protein